MNVESAPASDGARPSLVPMFKPKSVAVIGASATPFKHGNVAVKYLIAGGYAGAIYPINPAGGEIEGLKAYPSLRDVPGDVDCALILVPAAGTLAAMEDCAAKGVRAVIIGSSGYAEIGTAEGRQRQDVITHIARAHGMRVLGPNTNGIWNANAKLSLGYNTSHGDPTTPGKVAIVAHSGALLNSIAPLLRSFGTCLGKFVPVGNEADTDMLDIIEYFIEDEDTQVIGLIVESVRDGARLRALSHRARVAKKPLVALKLGRSQAGASAALAHSSRLAGSTRAYEALFRQCGFLQVRGIEAMAGTCALLADGAPVRGAGNFDLVCVSSSGGGAEVIADHAEEFGLRLAGNPDGSWGGAAGDVIATFNGAGLVRNPVDGGNIAGWANLEKLFLAAESDGCFGPVIFYSHRLPQERSDRAVAEILVRRRERTGAPVVCVSPGGLRESIVDYLASQRIPVFRDTATCFASLRCLYDVVGSSQGEYTPPALSGERTWQIRTLIDAQTGESLLSEIASSEILRAAGLPMIASNRVNDPRACLQALLDAAGPVVLKGIAPGIAHKNDAGLVVTGVTSATGMEQAYSAIENAFFAAGVDRKASTMIVQKMLPSRAELIAGVTYEPPLGHFLVAGFGRISPNQACIIICESKCTQRRGPMSTTAVLDKGTSMHRKLYAYVYFTLRCTGKQLQERGLIASGVPPEIFNLGRYD